MGAGGMARAFPAAQLHTVVTFFYNVYDSFTQWNTHCPDTEYKDVPAHGAIFPPKT